MSKRAFDQIQYPAFVVVAGPGKEHISAYNRWTYPAHFACDLCRNAEQAKRLAEGYGGPEVNLHIYAIPDPIAVVNVGHGQVWDEYRMYDGELAPDVDE